MQAEDIFTTIGAWLRHKNDEQFEDLLILLACECDSDTGLPESIDIYNQTTETVLHGCNPADYLPWDDGLAAMQLNCYSKGKGDQSEIDMPKSKPVQISTFFVPPTLCYEGSLVTTVLTEDGKIWEHSSLSDQWRKLPAIPA